MALPEIPKTHFATDENYTDGGPYDGQPNKLEPSSGRFAQGFAANKKLPAPRLNYMLNQLSIAADYALDSSVYDWTPENALVDADFVDHNDVWPQFLCTANGWLIVDQDMLGVGSVCVTHPGRGMDIAQDDSTQFAVGASFTDDTEGSMHSLGAESSPGVVLFHKKSTGAINLVQFFSHTWTETSGGTCAVLTSGSPTNVQCGSRLDGVTYLHAQNGTSSRWFYSSSMSGTWSVGAAVTRSESPGSFTQVMRGPSCYVLLSSAATTCLVNTGGVFTERSLGGSALSWSGAYNKLLGKFLAIGTDGAFASRIMMADSDATVWTQTTINGLTYGYNDVVAHGRGWIVSVGSGVPYFVAEDENGEWSARALPMHTPSESGVKWRLGSLLGRAVMGRVTHPSSESRRFEWWRSRVSPLMIDKSTGYEEAP